jgi:hypothetical protein
MLADIRGMAPEGRAYTGRVLAEAECHFVGLCRRSALRPRRSGYADTGRSSDRETLSPVPRSRSADRSELAAFETKKAKRKLLN